MNTGAAALSITFPLNQKLLHNNAVVVILRRDLLEAGVGHIVYTSAHRLGLVLSRWQDGSQSNADGTLSTPCPKTDLGFVTQKHQHIAIVI